MCTRHFLRLLSWLDVQPPALYKQLQWILSAAAQQFQAATGSRLPQQPQALTGSRLPQQPQAQAGGRVWEVGPMNLRPSRLRPQQAADCHQTSLAVSNRQLADLEGCLCKALARQQVERDTAGASSTALGACSVSDSPGGSGRRCQSAAWQPQGTHPAAPAQAA